MSSTETVSIHKPFLKWAGGKQRLIGSILPLLPPTGRYIEPFAGSAAVALNVPQTECLLSDINGDLIGLYQQLQDEGEGFIAFCRSFFSVENNTSERYYGLRGEFNSTRDKRRKSAIFVYLNKHGFNGLCRYSARGVYNVSFGKYARPSFPEAEMRNFLDRIRRGRVRFSRVDFVHALEGATAGDVVYCDPPYVPLSATSNFVGYSADGFGLQRHKVLAESARVAARRGATVVISNHDTPVVKGLYEGAEIRELTVRRMISCTGERKQAKELLAVFAPNTF